MKPLIGLLLSVPALSGIPVNYTAPATISVNAVVTAYTSSPDETDDTPLITASGVPPGIGTVACPSKYPFGTEVYILGKLYVCQDRMNERYRDSETWDVWVKTKSEAIIWGRKNITIEILK